MAKKIITNKDEKPITRSKRYKRDANGNPTGEKKSTGTYKDNKKLNDIMTKTTWDALTSVQATEQAFGVYVHNSVRTFLRALRQGGVALSIDMQMKQDCVEIIKSLDEYVKQVKPSNAGLTYDILNLFQDRGYNLTKQLDEIKYGLLNIDFSKFFKTMSNNLTTKKNKKGEVLYQVTGKNGNKYTVKKFDTVKKHLKENINGEIENKKKDSNNKQFIKMLDDMLEAIDKGKTPDDIVTNIKDQLADYETKANLRTTGQTASNNFVNPQDLIDKLQALMAKVSNDISPGHEKSYKRLLNIKSVVDFINQRKAYWSASGVVYEDLQRIDLIAGEKVSDVKVVGTSSANKINTSDLELTINNIKERIGVSMKQTIDFNKESELTDDAMKKKLQLSEAMIKKYKYFMINYSILRDSQSKGQVKQYESGDSNIEVSDIIYLYNRLNALVGKSLFIEGLLGNIIKSKAELFTEEGMPMPYILVTSKNAVFTYDVLQKLPSLLWSDAIQIDIPVKGYSKGAYLKLVNAKKSALREAKNGAIGSYDVLINEGNVYTNLERVNSAFFKNKDKEDRLSVKSTISMAKLMTLLGNKVIERN